MGEEIVTEMLLSAPGWPRHPRDAELPGEDMTGYGLAEALAAQLIALDYDAVAAEPQEYGWRVHGVPPGASRAYEARLACLDPAGPEAAPRFRIAIAPLSSEEPGLLGALDVAPLVAAHSGAVFDLMRGLEGAEVLAETASPLD